MELNNISHLDVSKNPKLLVIAMMTNHLTELDLSNNTEIEELYLAVNEFTQIPVIPQPHKVKILSLRDNKISDL